MTLTTDRISDVVALMRKVRLCIDPRFRGELARHYENPGVRRTYFAKRGVTIDELGELLMDRGFVSSRPSENDVLEIVEGILSSAGRKVTRCKDAGVPGDELEAAYTRAKTNRWRRWTCPSGCSSVRAGAITLNITCGVCGERLQRVDPLPQEITLSGIAIAEPFAA